VAVNPRHHSPCRHRAYRLTCADFNALYVAARGRCQICDIRGEDTKHYILHIDHDYRIGNHGVRGLLCSRCNTMLGQWPHVLDEKRRAQYLANPWHARDRLARLAALGDERQHLRRKRAENRDEIAAEIVAALKAGVPQVQVIHLSNFAREQVRRIARDGGIEPA
jgi:hypothetical protein